jgi:hypothetical protein
MTNANIKSFAEPLSDILMRMEDLKIEAAAIIDAAKEAGVDADGIKNLRKLAKEMVMEPEKLLKKYEAEEQMELFRDAVGIRERKGLTRRAA